MKFQQDRFFDVEKDLKISKNENKNLPDFISFGKETE